MNRLTEVKQRGIRGKNLISCGDLIVTLFKDERTPNSLARRRSRVACLRSTKRERPAHFLNVRGDGDGRDGDGDGGRRVGVRDRFLPLSVQKLDGQCNGLAADFLHRLC